jgi:hypothetical protein
MANELQTIDGATAARVLIQGDLTRLTESQKVTYYARVCDSLGLNPLTQPFAYIILNGKETLYAKREATEQLRKLHHVALTIAAREVVEDTYVVTARAVLPDGRTDESIGAKSIAGLKGEGRANAMMTAETKAKRRVTLSICGLGLLDETEVADLPPQALAQRIPKPAPLPAPEPDPEPDPPLPAPPPAAELPAGYVRILSIREEPTRNQAVTKYRIILSSGEEVSTINQWLATLAQTYHDEETPVRVTTKPTKSGTQLTALATDEPIAPEPMPAAADIPF